MKQNNGIKKHSWNINKGGFGKRKRTLVARTTNKEQYNQQIIFVNHTNEIYGCRRRTPQIEGGRREGAGQQYRRRWLEPKQSWMTSWKGKKILILCRSRIDWRSMTIWCSIIQYYTPSNKWKTLMLNQMNGGNWQRPYLVKKCKRI
jgi:hypothetical protein